jgi:hypothetical protein
VSDHDEDGVEELSDDVIIAQETIAHAPAQRARVSTDHPAVIISDVPGAPRKLPTVPPLRRADRTEKTVVIRDRKSLDKLRKAASRPPARRARSRTIYLVGAAVLASLAAGTLLATLANSASPEGTPAAITSAESSGPEAQPTASSAAPEVLDLEDLPVVKKKKKKKPIAE